MWTGQAGEKSLMEVSVTSPVLSGPLDNQNYHQMGSIDQEWGGHPQKSFIQHIPSAIVAGVPAVDFLAEERYPSPVKLQRVKIRETV